jgi:outer membrane protein OmpU
VTGSAAMNFENYSGSEMSSTKSFSMGNQLTFSGSGELDNGLNVSLSFVIDQGDDENNNETSPFDSHSVTISSDALGTLTYNGEGGDSAQNAVGDTAAGNIWDNFDGKNGATATLSESNSGTNFNYTLPSMVDGLAVGVSYLPAGANDESDTAYSLVYTGVEGLTLSYGSGTNDADAAGAGGTALNADTTSMKASYAIGSFTVAYSDHDHDSNTDTSDQTATSWKVSYTVSDALSVTYATESIDDNATAATSDAEYTKITAAHTSGGMTVSANYQESNNGGYTTAVDEDIEYIGLSVSFAF